MKKRPGRKPTEEQAGRDIMGGGYPNIITAKRCDEIYNYCVTHPENTLHIVRTLLDCIRNLGVTVSTKSALINWYKAENEALIKTLKELTT